jgi:hypothetical protein
MIGVTQQLYGITISCLLRLLAANPFPNSLGTVTGVLYQGPFFAPRGYVA